MDGTPFAVDGWRRAYAGNSPSTTLLLNHLPYPILVNPARKNQFRAVAAVYDRRCWFLSTFRRSLPGQASSAARAPEPLPPAARAPANQNTSPRCACHVRGVTVCVPLKVERKLYRASLFVRLRTESLR